MSLLGWAAGAFVVSRIIKNEKKRRHAKNQVLESLESDYYDEDEEDEDEYGYEYEDVRTPRIPCRFEDGISEEVFEAVVKKEAKEIRRIKSIEEYGGMVRGSVQSQSGISDWEFFIDFNYAGHITGAYSITSENTDSGIPSRLAENISLVIQALIRYNDTHRSHSAPGEDSGLYCPYCGEFTPGRNIKFCFYCGKQLL